MRILSMIILGYILTGCSKTSSIDEISYNVANQFSCTNKIKANSLDFLEQQYRCTSQK